MTKKVDILLLEDIPSLGKAGSVVSVNEGHARNFLFPQGKAALADPKAKKQVADKAQQDQKLTDIWSYMSSLRVLDHVPAQDLHHEYQGASGVLGSSLRQIFLGQVACEYP